MEMFNLKVIQRYRRNRQSHNTVYASQNLQDILFVEIIKDFIYYFLILTEIQKKHSKSQQSIKITEISGYFILYKSYMLLSRQQLHVNEQTQDSKGSKIILMFGVEQVVYAFMLSAAIPLI
jgi:hypothetical protein